MEPFVITYDWKGKPDWDKINSITSGWGKAAIFYEVNIMGDDGYSVVVSPRPLSSNEVGDIYADYLTNPWK